VRRAWICAVVCAASLLAAPAVLHLVPVAAAQDKDKDKEKEQKEKEEKERKEREKKKRDKALCDICNQFGAKDVSWLLDRVPNEQKLTLSLGTGREVDYSLDQARGVLQRYFDGLDTLSVDPKSKDTKLTETVGSFPMTYTPKEKKAKSATLYVTISGLDSTQNGLLTKLVVDPQ
jgi:hypothetical protein